jgi:hypothetical protein
MGTRRAPAIAARRVAEYSIGALVGQPAGWPDRPLDRRAATGDNAPNAGRVPTVRATHCPSSASVGEEPSVADATRTVGSPQRALNSIAER